MKKRYLFLIIFSLILPTSQALASSARQTPAVKVFQEWAGSVVNISTERIVMLRQNPLWGEHGGLFDEFFESTQHNALETMKTNSLGSGVIVSSDGLIATNAHVVHKASKIYVSLVDGATAEAVVIGTSLKNDLALIQIIPPHPVKPLKFAKDVIIGETVLAIGNPFGLQNSVSQGIISGTHRNFVPNSQGGYEGLVQTDAPINPGSSGGALLNLDGELVGINISLVQNSQSIGFAIPCEQISAMLKEYYELRSKNKVAVLAPSSGAAQNRS